jgi:elongation factor 2
MYAAKMKIELPKLMKRFWGENYYSPTEKKWSTSKGEGYQRGFTAFVLDPIFKVSLLITSKEIIILILSLFKGI